MSKMECSVTDSGDINGPGDDPIIQEREFDPELDKTPIEELERVEVTPDLAAGDRMIAELDDIIKRLQECRMAMRQAS